MKMNFYHDESERNRTQLTEDTYTTKRCHTTKHPLARKIGVLMLAGTLLGTTAGTAFTGSSYLIHRLTTVTSSQISTLNSLSTTTLNNEAVKPTNTTTMHPTTSSLSVSDIASQCLPSIVAITNVGVTDVMTFWGTMQQQSESSGSGVIIGHTNEELLIVTNYHVIEGSKTLTVLFSYEEDSNQPNAVEAYIKGYDSDKDLAVIAISTQQLSEETMNQIGIATVGNSNDLLLGEQVVAIGNALGYGQSVTTGIVSALNRTLTTTSTNQNNTSDINRYIQTDTAINPGNSGGALFNMKGELIGINTAKIASDSVEGMGYAIPISDVYDLIQELMNQVTRSEIIPEEERGYLGVMGSDVTSEISSAYGFPQGIYVAGVTDGSGASNAGITKGNIITKFDGKRIHSIAQLQNLLIYYKSGERVSVTIQVQKDSDYIEQEIYVTLDSYKERNQY